MDLHPHCLPCLAGLAHKGARAATTDLDRQLKAIQKALAVLSDHNPKEPAPVAAAAIQSVITETTGCEDPYARVKAESTAMALELLPGLKQLTAQSPHPLEAAIRLSIAGNIIDFATLSHLDRGQLAHHMDTAFDQPIQGNLPNLIHRLKTAQTILWIADNAGEIVFDRLVLEQLDSTNLTLAVRGGAALNDATRSDARAAKIPKDITIMDTGLALPGTQLESSTPEFQAAFAKADLIIAKGQGNFETLDHDDPRIVFLFQVKCPVIEKNSGFPMGSRMAFTPGQ
ncbi:MAG: ARMT1-like domain-containing protein [Desulfovibrionales bacterium]|nr:ARMT1-like domain-containing protein [Desulfovibrionales bacterium]